MSYDLVDECGLIIATFDRQTDSDRCASALTALEDYYSPIQLRQNPSVLINNERISQIPYIDDILNLLNIVLHGEYAELKLTERVLPFIKFFFASNTQPVNKQFFELLALFKKDDLLALIKYFRNIDSVNPEFRVVKEHDRLQALFVFWTAACVSGSLEEYLKVRVCGQVFFKKGPGLAEDSDLNRFYELRKHLPLQPGYTNLENAHDGFHDAETFFDEMSSKTQGLRISTDVVTLASKLLDISSQGIKPFSDEMSISRQVSRIVKYITLFFGGVTFKGIDEESVHSFFNIANISSYGVIFKPDIEDGVLDTPFNRLVYVSSKALSASICGLKNILFDSSTRLEYNLDGLESLIDTKDDQSLSKENRGQVSAIEDCFIVLLALNLINLCGILTQSRDVLPTIQSIKNLTLAKALELCVDNHSRIVRLSSKEIHDIYITDMAQTVGGDKTLFEYMWPLVQEMFRKDYRLYTRKSAEIEPTLKYLCFVDEIAHVIGEALATDNSELKTLCGLDWFCSTANHVEDRLVEDPEQLKLLEQYPELVTAANKHLKEDFYKGSMFEDWCHLDWDMLDFLNTCIFDSDLHARFKEGLLDLRSKRAVSEDGYVSIYMLPKEHILNLFVGHEEISNCCMFPMSQGFSCNLHAFYSSPVTISNIVYAPEGSHIVLGYDHKEESFIGSAWVYNLETINAAGCEEYEYHVVDELTSHTVRSFFQIDQFELRNKYETDTSLQSRVDDFVRLCILEYSSCEPEGFVFINTSGYTSDATRTALDKCKADVEIRELDIPPQIKFVSFGPPHLEDSDEEDDAQLYTDCIPLDCALSENVVAFTKASHYTDAVRVFNKVCEILKNLSVQKYTCVECGELKIDVGCEDSIYKSFTCRECCEDA